MKQNSKLMVGFTSALAAFVLAIGTFSKERFEGGRQLKRLEALVGGELLATNVA